MNLLREITEKRNNILENPNLIKNADWRGTRGCQRKQDKADIAHEQTTDNLDDLGHHRIGNVQTN